MSSSSKTPAGQQSEFQRSFSALVDCLRKAFREKGTVSIPNDVIAPFRRPFRPSDNSSLRDLAKILENGRPHKNIVRLDSHSFYYVASIVLHFPSSVVQSKLLYLFMETVRQYKNEDTLSSILSRIYGTDLTPTEIKDQGDFIGRKLSSCVLRHLVSRDKATQLRWRLAQFLSVLTHFSTAARDQVVEMIECQHLAIILEADQCHFLRILVADAIRELLYRGAERAVFGTSPTLRKIIEKLPLSKTGDSKWMADTVEYLSQIDIARAAAVEPDRMCIVQRLECDGNKFFEGPFPFVASVSNEISFLVPKGVEIGMITLFSVPVSKQVSISLVASQSDSSTTLEIRYPEDKGDRFVNGTRSAISNLTVTFCGEEGVEAFTQAIEERRNKKTPDAKPKAPGTSRKQSFAIIDISSASGDDDRGEGKTLNTARTSEIDASSPLRDISLRSRQGDGSAAASLLRKQVATPLSQADVQAGEDTPALRKPPDSLQFIDRLRASQEHATEKFPEKRSSSKQSQLRRSPRKTDSADITTTKKQPPHLPADTNEVSAPASSKVKPKGKGPAETSSSSLSNQAKKRSKPSVIAGQAIVDRDAQDSTGRHEQSKETMARPTGPGKVDSQASTVSAKPSLKRRADKELTTSMTEQSRKASSTTSNAVEFDLPPSDDEDIRPVKKAKIKTNKPSAKAAAKDPTEKKKSAIQVTASPKGHRKKENDKPKVKKLQEKETETTAASSRARRAAKTPKYIENSDESQGDGAGDDSGDEEDLLNNQNDDNGGETAEDSYPVDKGTYEAVTQVSRTDFESQLLPEMADKESTDDEAIPKEKHTQKSAVKQPTVSTALSPAQTPSEKHKQAGKKNEPASSKTTASQAVSKEDRTVRKPTAAEEAAPDLNPPVKNSMDGQTIREKNFTAAIVTDEESSAMVKPREQVSARQKATPQRNRKRLSETSIPPASEKLLRKTPIVHFGPQGPANQAVQKKLVGKEVTFRGVVDESRRHSLSLQFGDGEHVEEADELPQQLNTSPGHQGSTSQTDLAEEATSSGPVQASYEFPLPPKPANDNDMGYLDEPIQRPNSEAVVKLPEVDETQHQSPRRDNVPRAEIAEQARDSEEALAHTAVAQTEMEKVQAEVSAVQTIDTDDASSVERSYDQEASEYVASDVEEEPSVHSSPNPEPQPPRKSDARLLRPQTPRLDDDAPSRGYQRAREAPISRDTTRQSIGVSAILDEEYPTAQKAINTQKLREVHQSAAVNQTSRTRTPSTALPSITQRLKESGIVEIVDTVGTQKEVHKSSTESHALSVSAEKVALGSKSNGHDLTIEGRQERFRNASFHHATSDVESAADEGEVPVAKQRTQTLTRASSTKLSTKMSSTSRSARAAQPMAPPPLPQPLPSRATRKRDPPRKSWPESRAEKTTRLADAAAKEPIKSTNLEPVRIKKRLTLPLAANEPLSEPDLPPPTPASLSTRLDLHADLPIHSAQNDEDSRMEDAGHKLCNGSMTLVNAEESIRGDRSAMWARVGRRQRSESGDDDIFMAASPSRGKGNPETRNTSAVEKLTARDSQQGLLAAIVSITNDVLFRFGDEEDAIKAKVDDYHRGGKAFLDTLMDTWSQRLEHEHKILQDGLQAEEEFLSTATRLVAEKHTDGGWTRVVADDGLLGKVQKKGTRLTKQIEALVQ